MIGFDWSRESIIKLFNEHPEAIEIGGEHCRAMNHGLIVRDDSYLFIENDPEKLNAFDPINKKDGTERSK